MFDLTTIQLLNEQAVFNAEATRNHSPKETSLLQTSRRMSYFTRMFPSDKDESSYINMLNFHSQHSACERFST